jgi:dTDP-D-glucose 4,6-dehydratase
MTEEATSLLVLGGLGFVGRHFVKYVVDYQLASYIRVVDKRVPAMAYLTADFRQIFSHPSVEFVQANLNNDIHLERAFGKSERFNGRFNMVVNLAADTTFSRPLEFYEETIVAVRTKCARQAAEVQVDKYIEVSTTQVYAGSSKSKAKESDKIEPWTNLAKAHAAAEVAVAKIASASVLDHCVLRLPIVYGPGDTHGLMPRITVAAVYAKTKERMELLWGEGLRINTVHVQDAAAALYHLLCSGTKGETYNLVDKGDTSQGSLNAVLEQVFPGLKTGYYSGITSMLAQTQMDELVEEANGGHMGPWQDLCKECGISVTPLDPWLEKELLYNHHTSIDGSKLEATGFEVSCPQVTKDLVLDAIQYWTQLDKFPPLDRIASA